MKSIFPILAGLLALCCIGCVHTDCARTPSLAETYADSFRVGASLTARQIMGEVPDEQHLIDTHFNSYTASNEMKWWNLQPREGEYKFHYADALVAALRQIE